MIVKTRTTLEEGPQAGTTQTEDGRVSREAFLEVRNVAQCPGCQSVGKFILNGSTEASRQVVSCKACQHSFSSTSLTDIIKAAKNAQPPKKSSTVAKEQPASVAFTAAKLANDKLVKENEQMKNQYVTLLEKFEEADKRATTLQDANEKLCEEVKGLKEQLSTLTDQVAALLKRIPAPTHNKVEVLIRTT